MFKFPSVGRNQVAILSTLMVLIALGATYFFVYLPDNEKTVQERRFLCLQNIDNNIHSKIDNSNSLLNNLIMDYPKARDERNLQKFRKYINDYSKSQFTLLQVEETLVNNKKNAPPTRTGDTIASFKIDANPALQQFTLYASRTINSPKAKDSLTMGIRFGFEQFVKPLLPADVFDEYIVFNSNKAAKKTSSDKIVYQSFPSGLSYQTKDSLLTFKNGITTPGIRSFNIGGNDYKVFSQPVNFGGDSEWVIVGLVSGKNYNKEKNQLPVWIVLLLLTAALGMIVSLPWIKLYHMGNKDKLTVTDGISTILVSMLLMSLLFFIFFQYNLYLSNTRSSKSIGALSAHISKGFTDELDTAYNTLGKFDAEYNIKSKKSKLRDDIIYLDRDSIAFKNRSMHNNRNPGRDESDENKKLNQWAKNIAVDQVYWLDKTGQELNNWTTGSLFIPHSNLGSREYFKRIVNNDPYRSGNEAFYLEQVVSRTSGTFTTVIAKKPQPGKAVVVAMSFTVKSLDSVVMPDGYQFAIIDNKGEVLYHSLANRNLNENLKNELADSSELVSALESQSDTSFKADYYGKSYNIKINPVKNLPYFTVIFEDIEYNDTRDTEAYAFTISMLICLLVFLITQFCIVFFVSSQRSFFKKQLFETSWIGPKKQFHKHYSLSVIIHFAIICLLLYYFDLSSFLKYLFILLFSITFINIFLNGIFAISYRLTHSYNLRFKLTAIFWLLMFVGLIDFVAHHLLDPKNFSDLLIYEGTLTITCAALTGVCFYINQSLPNILLEVHKLKNIVRIPWTFTHSFALMATTRLIITSGLPVAFFFIYSFNYEQNLDTRYKQYHFAKALTQKIPFTSIKNKSAYQTGIYTDDLFIDSIQSYTSCKKSGAKTLFCSNTTSYKAVQRSPVNSSKTDSIIDYTKEDSITVKLLNAFRLHNNDVAIKSNNMNFLSIDSVAFFNNLTHEQRSTRDITSTRTYYKVDTNKYIGISSASNIYRLSHKWLLILFLILLVGFYYVIHNIIRKLFALNLPLQEGWKEMDNELLLDAKLNSLLLIVGSPGSGKLSKLKTRIAKGELDYLDYTSKKADGSYEKRSLVYNEADQTKGNVFVADMIHIPADDATDVAGWNQCKKDAIKDTNELVIINHFEYNIKNSKTNITKLDLLEALMLQGKSKIIIISTVHPLTFLDSFNEEQNNTLKPTAASTAQQNAAAPNAEQSNTMSESELQRWHVLLGHFRIIIEPLVDKDSFDKDILQQSIRDETRYTHYLNDMQEAALRTLPSFNRQGIGLASDSQIFKMQISSHYFYTYIWQSLTKEEKFLLYDLAEDGLVNPYDDFNLSMLIYKGLITRENGTLTLFNKGFRNYILTAIGNTEVNRIKALVKDNGNWASLRGPLNLAILAILVFLIASQQEAYTRIITYVTALGAGVPAVLRIFSLVSTNNSTQKTQ